MQCGSRKEVRRASTVLAQNHSLPRSLVPQRPAPNPDANRRREIIPFTRQGFILGRSVSQTRHCRSYKRSCGGLIRNRQIYLPWLSKVLQAKNSHHKFGDPGPAPGCPSRPSERPKFRTENLEGGLAMVGHRNRDCTFLQHDNFQGLELLSECFGQYLPPGLLTLSIRCNELLE